MGRTSQGENLKKNKKKTPRIVNIERFGVWVFFVCAFVFFLFPWGDVLAVTFG